MNNGAVTQAEKSDERTGSKYCNSGKYQGKQNAHLDRSRRILGGLLRSPAAERMGHLHLASHLGQRHNSLGKPCIHAGRAHCRHRGRPHQADPRHIRQAVCRLDQRRRHNRQGQSRQRRKNMAMQQIYLLTHIHLKRNDISSGRAALLAAPLHPVMILLSTLPVVILFIHPVRISIRGFLSLRRVPPPWRELLWQHP